MTNIDQMREHNEEKAEGEFERGPIADGAEVPIADAIAAYQERDEVSFAIPAHRAGTGAVAPRGARWLGADVYAADASMSNGVDNRHQSWQVQETAQSKFAEALGADKVLFSTNGSSQNVRVAMMAVVKPGETIAVARNGHKSVFAGLVVSGAWPVYIEPEYDTRLQLAHGIAPERLEAVLDEHPQARAALIPSPTYYGVSSDVRALSDIAHRHGIPLVADAAWGLKYSFCSRLPSSPEESGADLSIGSVHKSLSGLGQTSVLALQGDLVDPSRLEMIVELEQSTSASAVLLASIDAAREEFARDGERLFSDALRRTEALRERINEIPGLSVFSFEDVRGPGAVGFDPLHVTIEVSELGITGYSAADWLQQHQGIHVELSDHRRIMPIVTYADNEKALDRLLDGLRGLAEHAEEADRNGVFEVPGPEALRTETVMLPRDAFLGATELVDWRDAPGRISAEMICPYPPGIPIIAPGERLTSEIVDYLEGVAAAGGIVEGAADPSLAQLRVVAR